MVRTLICLFFLLIYVVPAISGTFIEAGTQLPLMTKILISFSEFVRERIVFVVLFFAVILFGMFFYKRTEPGQLFFDRIRVKVPFLGDLYISYITAKFSRTLSTVLSAGIPLINAARISIDAVNNKSV